MFVGEVIGKILYFVMFGAIILITMWTSSEPAAAPVPFKSRSPPVVVPPHMQFPPVPPSCASIPDRQWW